MLEELKGLEEKIATMLFDKIGDEYNLSELRIQLLSIPGEIAKFQKKAKITEQQLLEIQQQLGQIEAEIMYEINMETNGAEKPKPKFSNAEIRKAEVAKRLKVHTEHLKLQHERGELELVKTNHEIAIDQLRNTFRAQMAIKDLIVAEMNLYKS